MIDTLEQRIAAAESAMQRGDRSGAVVAWKAVLELQPNHPVALNVLGNWELAQGNAKAAQGYLKRAVAADPGQPALLFNLAAAARAAKDMAGALVALEEALAVDPDFVQAMFQMAIVYEEIGQPRSAAQIFRNFLDTAPPEVLANPKFAEPIRRARAAIEADNDGLGGSILFENAPPSLRAAEAANALLGKDRIYVAEPTFLTVPRLPAIPFLDRALTPWLTALEAAAPGHDQRT
jgi:aspartate beta-hydroxylase